MVAKMEGPAPSHLRRIRQVIIFISRRQYSHLRFAAKVRRLWGTVLSKGCFRVFVEKKGKRAVLLAKGRSSARPLCGVLMPTHRCGLQISQAKALRMGTPVGGTRPSHTGNGGV